MFAFTFTLAQLTVPSTPGIIWRYRSLNMIDQEIPLGLSFSGNTPAVFYSMVKQVPANLILVSRMDAYGGGTSWMYQFDSLCTTYLME